MPQSLPNLDDMLDGFSEVETAYLDTLDGHSTATTAQRDEVRRAYALGLAMHYEGANDKALSAAEAIEAFLKKRKRVGNVVVGLKVC